MDSSHHKSILLTTPEGFKSHLYEPASSPKNDVEDIEHIVPADERKTKDTTTESLSLDTGEGNVGVQFDSEQLERGRSRIMKRDLINGSRSNSDSKSISMSRSRSRSRSMSRSRSRIREEEFLKWTVLRQDPSIRLYNKKKRNIKKKEHDDDETDEDGDDEETRATSRNEDSDEDDDSEEDEEEEEEEEESDEEQVSDIENDAEIDSKFDYDPGMKVLPNFCISINDVLESSKPWITKYTSENGNVEKINEDIKLDRVEEGYVRGLKQMSKGEEASETNDKPKGKSYILYMDLTSESMYALTYVLGTVVNNDDTLYVVQWESSSKKVTDETIVKNINKISLNVLHLFDCISGVIDRLDVIILSLTHPYPKHLLSEMIYGLKPLTLCCSLSIILSGLQNFVCSVPTLVIRKKLKRTKKKGICE